MKNDHGCGKQVQAKARQGIFIFVPPSDGINTGSTPLNDIFHQYFAIEGGFPRNVCHKQYAVDTP